MSNRYALIFVSAVALASVSYAFNATAAVVRHTLLPTDSVFSVQTQHSCGTYLLQPSPHWCNPALFSFANDAPIKAELALNADQDAYDTTNRFLNEPIDKEFVDHLFKEKDFQSFSGLTRLEAMSEYLSFSYIPAYLVGVYQLTNPNLPEISAAGVRESQVRFSSGMQLALFDRWSVYGGGTATFYDRKLYYLHANVLQTVVQDIETLIEQDRKRGINADFGLFVKNDTGSLPSFSLVGENIFSPQSYPVGSSRALALEPNFARRIRITSGYTYNHVSGSYHLSAQMPFWDFGAEFDRLGASTAFIYGIGRLRTFLSFSPLLRSFGFAFMSQHYLVGIQYTNDKQDNSLELRRRKNVYLFASFNF